VATQRAAELTPITTAASGTPCTTPPARSPFRAGLRDAGPIALAGLMTNLASGIVTIVIARLLTVRGYGVLAQLLGLFLVVSMPGSAVVVGVVRRIAERRQLDGPADTWRWARRVHTYGIAGLVVFAALVFGVRGEIAHVLSAPNADGVFAIITAGGVWVLLSVDRGLLQGHREYRKLSINLLVEGAARTVGILGLVGAGLGVAGAGWGLLLAELVTALQARVMADRAWSREARRAADAASATAGPAQPDPVPAPADPARPAVRLRRRERRRPRQLARDVGAALVALALLAYLQNVDVIVFGREAPHRSGSYAAISVSCKVLAYAATALAAYLLPEAAIRWRAGGHALHQTAVAVMLLGIPSVILLAVAVIAPGTLLRLVFSSKYLGAEHAFVPLALAMVCLSATIFMTMYLLAIGRRRVGFLLVVGAVVATVAVASAHGNPATTAWADLAVQAGLGAVVMVHFLGAHRGRVRRGAVRGRTVALLRRARTSRDRIERRGRIPVDPSVIALDDR